MSSSKEIYKRICSVTLLQQITKTMKLISVSRLTKLQNLLNNKRKFLQALNEIQANIDKINIFSISDDIIVNEKTLIIPVGSDKGFCGAFNSSIYKTIINYIKSDTSLMPIGSKLFSLFNKTNCKLIDSNVNLLKFTNDDDVKKIATELLNMLTTGDYENIVFIYNKFLSTSLKQVVIENISMPKHEVDKNTESTNENSESNNEDESYVIYESSACDINKFFMENIFIYKFLNIIYESLTSENASRMITMNKASDNSDNLLKALKILYNKSRQASITNEIIEISAGTMSVNK